jgi:hypothetical protein
MRHPLDGRNPVMQLNKGEGKSSVIELGNRSDTIIIGADRLPCSAYPGESSSILFARLEVADAAW